MKREPSADDSYYRRYCVSCNVQLYMTATMSWNADVAYAFTPYKILTLPLGIWPLQKYNTFALVCSIVCCFSLVRSPFSRYSILMNFFSTLIFDVSTIRRVRRRSVQQETKSSHKAL